MLQIQLTAIALPNIELDSTILQSGRETLQWMCSKNNQVAKARWQDLEELSNIADLVKSCEYSLPQPFELPKRSDSSNRFWPTLDNNQNRDPDQVNIMFKQRQTPLTMNFWEDKFDSDQSTQEMFGDYWLWDSGDKMPPASEAQINIWS